MPLLLRSSQALLLGLVLACLLPITAGAQEGYRVITHPDVGADTLTRTQIADLFLKKKKEWGQDLPARPVVLKVHAVEDAFCNDVIGRSSIAVKKYWQRQIFTGRGTPPEEMKQEADLVAFVARTPGAIGFVSPNAEIDTNRVQVVTVR